jgi:hypothetical protein
MNALELLEHVCSNHLYLLIVEFELEPQAFTGAPNNYQSISEYRLGYLA